MSFIKDDVYNKYIELVNSDHSKEIQAQIMGNFVREKLNQNSRILAIKLKDVAKETKRMDEMEEYLQKQLRNIIANTCNVVGCDKCPDKWEGGCIATDIQDKIFNLEEDK